MRVSPILAVAAAVAAVALSASPAVAGVSAPGERDDYQAVAQVIGHKPHFPHATPRPTPTSIPTPAATGTPTPSRVASFASRRPSSPAAGTASPSRALTATPGVTHPPSTPTHTGSLTTPAGTITGDSDAGGSGGGETGTVIGVFGVLLAAAVGGVFWRQLRKKRRFKDTWLPPTTVPFAPRDRLALPPAANPFAGQALGRPQKQAPWERPTLVDMRWAQGLPPVENPFPGQDPQQRPSRPRSQALPPVENPTLDGDRNHARVQHPAAGAYAAPLDIPPSGNPVAGRHAVRQPRPAQSKRRKPQ